MSGRIVLEVLRYAPEDLTPAELLVYVVLAENAREHSRMACLASEVVAERARVSVGTVHKAQSALARRGLIVPQLTARVGTTQRYLLVPLDESHRTATHREPSRQGRQEPSRTASLAPVDNFGGGVPSLPVDADEPSCAGRPLRKTTYTTSSPLTEHDVSGRLRAIAGGAK